MTVAYLGDYDPTYSRHRLLLRSLRELGVTVVETQLPAHGWAKHLALVRAVRSYRRRGISAILFAYSNSRLVWLARLFTRLPIIWDAFYSLYDNWVFDRKLAAPRGPKALYYWLLDWLCCYAATLVVLDTNTDAEYFANTFGVPRRKLARILVSADTEVFYPRPRTRNDQTFEVEFHGKYIPVQGTEVMVRAAKLLASQPDIHFTLIGGGQNLKKTRALAEELAVGNVTFLSYLTPAEVAGYVAEANVTIGIIGDVPRVVRAIPNKLYEAAAMARVCINADTPALREIFTPGHDVIGIRPGDAEALAAAILELKRSGQGDALGRAARQTFTELASPVAVTSELRQCLDRVAGRR